MRVESDVRESIDLVEQAPVSIITLTDYKISYVNRFGIQMLGGSNKSHLLGKSFFDFVPVNREGGRRIHSKLMEENRHDNHGIEGTLVTLSGETIEVEIQYTATFSQELSNHHLVIRDITKFKENQKVLQHSEKLSLLGELAAGIAHEIRNPLTSLKGFLQLLSDKEVNPRNYTPIMLSEIERINEIVNELLLLSKPKDMTFESKPLIPIINTVVTLAKTQAILFNIEIETSFESDHFVVMCEENKLKQVFINLLKNAIEAMSKEGTIKINVKHGPNHVFINIIDQGAGISSDKLAELGKRFYSTKKDGTGLGLMISFSIIENHGGKMTINSEEGIGTTVEIMLPK